MEVQTIVDPDTGLPKQHYIFEPHEQAVMTGPVTGLKTLADGTVIDVTPPFVALETVEQVALLNDVIGLHHVENGHPDDVDHLLDPETGKTIPVQRPFVFTTSEGDTHIGCGVRCGEHPLDEVNDVGRAAYPTDVAADLSETVTPTETKEA